MFATADSNCGQVVGFASPSANKGKRPHIAASVAMPPPAAFGRDFGQSFIAELLKSSSNHAAVSHGHLKRNSSALAAHANSGRVPEASIAPRHRISRMTARTANVKRSPANTCVVEAEITEALVASTSGRGRFRHWLSSAALS